MERLISIYEAANILGCSHQTILNWCKQGVLQRHELLKEGRKKKFAAVDRETVLALVDDVKAIEESKAKIKEIREQIEKERHEFTFKAIVSDVLKFKPTSLYEVREIAMTFFYWASSVLTARESQILFDFINGKTIGEMGVTFGLSNERVRQLIYKSVHKLKKVESFQSILEENQRLKEDIEMLKRSNNILEQDANNAYEHLLAACQKCGINAYELDEPISDEQLGILKLFSTNLVDCDLSVRALNCLACANIKTIGDLVQYNKTDLLKFRNFGKKTLGELDDFLEDQGLMFGMNVTAYYRQAGRKIAQS